MGASRSRAAVASVAALLCAALAAAAQAQLGDVGEQTVDTPYTPAAKPPPAKLFTQVAGARWKKEGPDLPADSFTPLEADLFAVSFRDQDAGFVGGSIDVGGERRPVLYGYTNVEGWEKVELPNAPDREDQGKGYIADIAWIDSTHALAVGGDGTYPDREKDDGSSTCAGQGAHPEDDAAGKARVWLYTHGEGWRELEQRPDAAGGLPAGDDDLPDGMRALSALDFYLPRSDEERRGVEFGVAGGLCQLWHWRDGSFEQSTDGAWRAANSMLAAGQSPPAYRIRDIGFAKPTLGLKKADRRPRAYAVTSGCCLKAGAAADLSAKNGAPETLTYAQPASIDTHPAEGTWTRAAAAAALRLTTPDTHVSVTATQGFWSNGVPLTDSQPRILGPGRVTSPGGPKDPNEPPSQVDSKSVGMSSVWLADGDGDVGGGRYQFNATVGLNAAPEHWDNALLSFEVPPWGYLGTSNPPSVFKIGGRDATGPDGVPDWSVGELSSSHRAIVYGTDPAQLPPPAGDHLRLGTCAAGDGLGNLQAGGPATAAPPDCRVNSTAEPANRTLKGEPPTDPDRIQNALKSSRLLALSSYTLHAIDMLDSDGEGWAVGERGAIVRISPDVAAAARPKEEAPKPPEPQRALLPDRSPWAGLRPPAAQPGVVPALVSRPRVQQPEPKLHVEPGPVPTPLFTPDRRQGWSFAVESVQLGGGLGYPTTKAHAFYDNGKWYRCAVASEASHEACSSFAEVARELRSHHIVMRGPQRVPLENDGDPSNDGEIELIVKLEGNAYTSPNAPPLRLARFRDGRWELVREHELGALGSPISWYRARDPVFTSPDDGYIYVAPDSFEPTRGHYSFDGKTWSDCTQTCDPGQRLPSYANLLVVGERIYAYGSRNGYPLIMYRTREKRAWSETLQPGEHDPGWRRPSSSTTTLGRKTASGSVAALSITRNEHGDYQGWALGTFKQVSYETGTGPTGDAYANLAGRTAEPPTPYRLLRIEPDGTFEPRALNGALADHARSSSNDFFGNASFVTLPSQGSRPSVFLNAPAGGYIYALNPLRNRWETLPTGGPPGGALTSDGSNGFWSGGGDYVYHYTDRPLEPVFDEVAPPARHPAPQLKGMAAAADGTVWAITDSDAVYRYDRLTGWNSVRIAGWDPGRLVTVSSPAHAVAVTPDGSQGLVVGKGGRIARLDGESVTLGRASRSECDKGAPVAPCGTLEDLNAVAVAPDGAAIVAGRGRRSLLWRPAGGELRAIDPPDVDLNASYTSVAIASADRVWALAKGTVYAGRLEGSRFVWRSENEDEDGNLRFSIDKLALDADGHGYGISNVLIPSGNVTETRVYERTGEGEPPWRLVECAVCHELSALALPAGGGEGALLGGRTGSVFSYVNGAFELVRPADDHGFSVAALALAPGIAPGQVEAWAVTHAGGGGGSLADLAGIAAKPDDVPRLFHYASDRGEPLLDPSRGVKPLPDAPLPRPGELSLAAFGKSDCHAEQGIRCSEWTGQDEYAQNVTRRSVEELIERSRRGEGPSLAVSTGDSVDEGGYPGNQPAETAGAPNDVGNGFLHVTSMYGPRKLRRWGEAIADRLSDNGVPTFGAVGFQDLSGATQCGVNPHGESGFFLWAYGCANHKNEVRAGENLAWRQSMKLRSGPWGGQGSPEADGRSPEAGGLRFERVSDERFGTLRSEDTEVSDPDAEDGPARGATVSSGGADTHYAIDVSREGEDGPVARLVFADSSLGSLSAADAIQQPVEPDGQAAWLERVLCVSPGRTPQGRRCSRAPDQRAIVVTNTPSYSYGPGAISDTLADSTSFETILMRHKVDLVVSGRIGWNGRYWATAPGVHEPCPGSPYPEAAPSGPSACGHDAPQGTAPPSAEALAGALRGTAPEPAGRALDSATGAGGGVARLLPFVVASGSGGKFFGGDGPSVGETKDGFWHGYTIVRVDRSGDPAKMVVEQRPVYDWVGITAQERTLRAGQRMTLRGFARGPIGARQVVGNLANEAIVRYDRIDSPAVTHRYDLLAADPAKPWLPRRDADGQYVPLDPTVGVVDSQTGVVRAGRGHHARTYAIGVLSVGQKAASYPLVFEPGKSFRPRPSAFVPVPPAPRPAAPVPQIHVLGQPPVPPPASPPPASALPSIGELALPAPPSLPPLPQTLAASPTTPPPPPAPPPPPPPPTAEPLALNALLGQTGVTTSPIPPNAPAVNPAPPSGSAARKEAKQRQAATAKSEEGASEQASDATGDLAIGRDSPDQAMTRRDRVSPGQSFTPLARPEQASAWARGALYGGGLGLMAFTMAAAWITVRPTPRRRPPTVPSPAWARPPTRPRRH